jgi:hypothetical protein
MDSKWLTVITTNEFVYIGAIPTSALLLIVYYLGWLPPMPWWPVLIMWTILFASASIFALKLLVAFLDNRSQ